MSKYLLFLNARTTLDEQQVILYAANILGYKVIYLNNNLPVSLMEYVDFCCDRKTDVIEQVVELSQQHDIRGVFSFNDTDVELAADICSVLKIPGVDPQKIILARNKYLMRGKIAQYDNTLVPKYYLIKNDDELPEVDFPAVIKPISAAGSKGIFIVKNNDELLDAYYTLKKISASDKALVKYGDLFIVEEFISGQEFSVDGVVVNNKLHIAGITDKQTTNPWCLEYRQVFPANYKHSQKIKDFANKIINILGLHNCAVHLEAKYHNNTLKLVEIAARTGGDFISTHLISNSLGINWIATIIDSIVDQKPPYIPKNTLCTTGVQFKLANNIGIFNGFNIDSRIYNIPGIMMCKELITRGMSISLPPNDFVSQRLGYAVAYGKNFDLVTQNLQSAVDNIGCSND